MLVLEQNVRQILRRASRAYALENDVSTLADRAADLASDPEAE